jgi:PKD repeat protein
VVPNPVPLGTPVSLSTTFADPGVNDNPLATINWGDGHQNAGSVSWTLGTGSVTGGHTYAAPGTYTVTVTVNDKDGGTNSASLSVVVNAPPTIDAAGPYSGVEGTPLALAGTASDPDGDPLALSWSFAVTTDPGGSCSFSGTATLVPSVTCSDDSTIVATLKADDGVNPPVTRTTTITVANIAPSIGLVTVPVAPVPVGTAVTALTTFADPGSNDTHTATINWGDATTSAGTVSESAGNGSVTGSHAYAAAGTYTLSITIVDDDAGTVTGTAVSRVVVFDGGNGFVSGGGWITSPSGAYTPNDPSDPDLIGRANYGFVIRKDASDSVPTGNTEFQLRLAQTTGKNAGKDGFSTTPKFNFKADAYTTLTVTSSLGKAVYRGTGTLDGVAGYQFLVSVIDGRSAHVADKFRIKIWKTSTGVVFYDNLPGAADDATATSDSSGGSIIIH